MPAPKEASNAVNIIRSTFYDSFTHLNRNRPLDDFVDGKFTFLNRTLKIEPIDSIDWNRRYENHLWNYHLHYFDYAVWCARGYVTSGDDRAMRLCQKLIESWIEGARVGRSDGWDAYPISLRAVNWIYAYALIADNYPDRDFLERWRAGISRQLDFLSDHLEFHLLANHLLKNIKAMIIGGLFFDRENWLARAGRLLWREFDEQVLRDGGHYERAPMYHAQALADFLECYGLLRSFDRLPRDEAIESRLRAMAGFLEAMSYPDGTLALFNDSANTEDTSPFPIIETAKGVCGYQDKNFPREFEETGYYLWISPDEKEKIIVDAGPPSADYNTAHAHCDLLSYELRFDGRAFIVDSGVHGYGGDRFREYCRSTRAHNTVMFDGREQSEVWGTFRMARRATLVDAAMSGDEKTWIFRGSYRPYYDSRLVHRRSISREASGEWHIEDSISGSDEKQATSFIHLHPDVIADSYGGAIECQVGKSRISIVPFAAEEIKIAEGWYFPDFGIAQRSAMICIDYRVKRDEPFGYKIKCGNKD